MLIKAKFLANQNTMMKMMMMMMMMMMNCFCGIVE